MTLASKIFGDQCIEMTSRKPVKDCYCYSEMKKMCQRLSKFPQKCASSYHCTSQSEFTSVRETDKMLVSPISCKTFKQVQKINYTPKSQFLRKVQNKICELQSGCQRNCLQMCPQSFSYHRFMANGRMQDIWDGKATLSNERKHVDVKQKSRMSPRTPANSLVSESDHDNTVCTSSVKTSQVSLQNLVKLNLRKTIKSRRQVSESSKSSLSKSSIRKNNRKQDCSYTKMICNQDDNLEQIAKKDEDQLHTLDVPECFKENYRCLKCDDKSVDRRVQDLRRFRDQYYFETHGSSHTLASSRSSGSLEQYFLNDRLFPESVGKIHKGDLVVTMPPCATTQKKRIHYFPRYVIRQEKDIYNSNYRLKQYQINCPLTGHAIDLGAVKIKLPVGSLALKYQKKT